MTIYLGKSSSLDKKGDPKDTYLEYQTFAYDSSISPLVNIRDIGNFTLKFSEDPQDFSLEDADDLAVYLDTICLFCTLNNIYQHAKENQSENDFFRAAKYMEYSVSTTEAIDIDLYSLFLIGVAIQNRSYNSIKRESVKILNLKDSPLISEFFRKTCLFSDALNKKIAEKSMFFEITDDFIGEGVQIQSDFTLDVFSLGVTDFAGFLRSKPEISSAIKREMEAFDEDALDRGFSEPEDEILFELPRGNLQRKLANTRAQFEIQYEEFLSYAGLDPGAMYDYDNSNDSF